MKGMILFAVLAAAAATAQGVTVSGVAAHQRWPWNGLVDVDFTVSGAPAAHSAWRVHLTAAVSGGSSGGGTLTAKTFATESAVVGDGQKRVTWNLGTDAPELGTADLSVTVTLVPLDEQAPLYMVIDVSAGSSATSYPVRYTTVAPDPSTDACRTTEIWLRRCPAGSFTMGHGYAATDTSERTPPHLVHLTKPFWCAVFETTQAQWERVRGAYIGKFSNPDYRDKRPVESVLTSAIRGDRVTDPYVWPGSTNVASGSFVGRLQSKTGFNGTTSSWRLDIPTEAQWEYACRAGTSGTLYDKTHELADICNCNTSGISYADNASEIDGETADLSVGTKWVGSYPPNPWGLYDMYGNVGELVLDQMLDGNFTTNNVKIGSTNSARLTRAYYENTEVTDPAGPDWSLELGVSEKTGYRAYRGGDWKNSTTYVNSVTRSTRTPGKVYGGFRIVVTEE